MTSVPSETPTADTPAADPLGDARHRLLTHPLYDEVDSHAALCAFMREHAFAVWDFMSLLKRLQQLCTCTAAPWLPVPDARLARFINEIVLGEESDEDGRGGYASHYDLYLEAMDELGADAAPVRRYVELLRAGGDPLGSLDEVPVRPETRAFVRFTLGLCRFGQPHELAAAFCFGREDVIPEMFRRLLPALDRQSRATGRLKHYLLRHIELDGDVHGPLARHLLAVLCHGDPQREAEAANVARQAIDARLTLWDGIRAAVGPSPA